MATKKTTPTVVTAAPLLDPATAPDPAAADAFAELRVDPTPIAAEAEATAAASNTQRRAILARLALATQLPEADLLILFGLPA